MSIQWPLMAESVLVRVGGAFVDPQEALAFVADPAAGGTCVFVGTVRDHSNAGDVTSLEIRHEPDALRLVVPQGRS